MMIFEIIDGRPRLLKRLRDMSWRFNNILYFFGGLGWAIQDSPWVRERLREYLELIIILVNPECDPSRDLVLIKEVAKELLIDICTTYIRTRGMEPALYEELIKCGIRTPPKHFTLRQKQHTRKFKPVKNIPIPKNAR